MKSYSTKEAAAYLGLCVGSIKYHIYQTKLLKPQKAGNRLVFTQAQLDVYANLPTYPPPDPDRVRNERYSSAYARWRKAVEKRDNYTCQICEDDNPVGLVTHHIKSWAKYPDLRFDVDNGLTLCKDCHHLQHYPFKHWEREAAAQILTDDEPVENASDVTEPDVQLARDIDLNAWTPEMKLFSTPQAADYLGLSVPAIKYHVYQGHIKPQKVGHSLVFTQAQLDEFKSTRRPRGRPRSKDKEPQS